MLTSVAASGVRPALAPLVMNIGNAMSDAIQIKNIEGLDPIAATIASSDNVGKRGKTFGTSTVGERNIVLTVGLNPNWATQDMTTLRQELYKYFMPQAKVDLEFVSTHLPTCEISGIVEDMTPNMFSQDPSIDISILCAEPDFVSIASTVLSGTTLAGWLTVPIVYAGSQSTGVLVKVTNSVAVPNYLNDLHFEMTYDTVETFALDDVTVNGTYFFELSTVPGSKYARRVEVANTANQLSLLNKLLSDKWIQLKPGANSLRLWAASSGLNWQITYFERYGGL